MKIIDVAICLDNRDPQGIGRIRYNARGKTASPIEKSMPYEDWDMNDQFVALPFLPLHLNVIPQIGQSVKIIQYDTDKDTQNVEYIAGPFASPHDFGSETFTTQNKYTTYGGVVVKDRPSVRDKNSGNYLQKESEATLPKLKDVGFSGNYGSDLIFTEDGVLIRGGKLVSKSTKNKRLKKQLQDIPLSTGNMAKINLKKFPQKMEMKIEQEVITEIVVVKINYIIEYELDSLSNPTMVKFFVYKVKNNYGTKYNTNVFTLTTNIFAEEVQLINTDNTTTTPTATFTETTLDKLKSAARIFLQDIQKDGLSKIDSKYPSENIHPLFFRPTPSFMSLKPTNSAEEQIKINFLNGVKLFKSGPQWGLYFSRYAQNPPNNEVTKDVKKLVLVNDVKEQSFITTSSDKIFILSTDSNKGEKDVINFPKLDKYEYTQENLLNDIEPYTYALVRGETLINLLNLIYNYLTKHKHNINDTPLYLPDEVSKLDGMMRSLESLLINKSIRIN